MESLDYKNENIDRKHWENIQNNEFLQVKTTLLELKKKNLKRDRKTIS